MELLQIVPVRIHGKKEGTHRDTYALLNSGSESSFCSEAVLTQLGITGQDEQLCLHTVERTGKPQASTRVKLELSSVAPEETRRIIVPEAWSVPSLDIPMPNVSKKQR